MKETSMLQDLERVNLAFAEMRDAFVDEFRPILEPILDWLLAKVEQLTNATTIGS